MPEVIKFYIREDPYGFLSNFWRVPQWVNRRMYKTNEHWYQSQKALNMITARWIANAPTAYQAMMAGRALRDAEIVPDWDIIKDQVMLTGLREKFGRPFNREVRSALLSTGDAILIEDSSTDRYWGGGLPDSKNMLGKLLMQVRDELREKQRIKDSKL